MNTNTLFISGAAVVSAQKNSSRILQGLDVNLTASDVAQVMYKQIKRPKTHRTVSIQYGILHFLNDISPAVISRLVMKYLNRT